MAPAKSANVQCARAKLTGVQKAILRQKQYDLATDIQEAREGFSNGAHDIAKKHGRFVLHSRPTAYSGLSHGKGL